MAQAAPLPTACWRLPELPDPGDEPRTIAAGGRAKLPVTLAELPWIDAVAHLSAADDARIRSDRLFVDRARAVDHPSRSTDENAPRVVEICRRLDGIPLAIELAAARVNSLTALACSCEGSRIVSGVTGGERPRRRASRRCVRRSIGVTTPLRAGAAVFERLSVFAGGCTFGGAQTLRRQDVSEADVVTLILVLDKSMVIADLDGVSRVIGSWSPFGSTLARSSRRAANDRPSRNVMRSRISTWPNGWSIHPSLRIASS